MAHYVLPHDKDLSRDRTIHVTYQLGKPAYPHDTDRSPSRWQSRSHVRSRGCRIILRTSPESRRAFSASNYVPRMATRFLHNKSSGAGCYYCCAGSSYPLHQPTARPATRLHRPSSRDCCSAGNLASGQQQRQHCGGHAGALCQSRVAEHANILRRHGSRQPRFAFICGYCGRRSCAAARCEQSGSNQSRLYDIHTHNLAGLQRMDYADNDQGPNSITQHDIPREIRKAPRKRRGQVHRGGPSTSLSRAKLADREQWRDHKRTSYLNWGRTRHARQLAAHPPTQSLCISTMPAPPRIAVVGR